MASIDWSTLAVGALIGIGCRKQLKSTARVAATTAASLASAAAVAVNAAAAETYNKSESNRNNGGTDENQD